MSVYKNEYFRVPTIIIVLGYIFKLFEDQTAASTFTFFNIDHLLRAAGSQTIKIFEWRVTT